MSNTLPSIIIGIPAFNEEANIGFLLQDIEKQKAKTFTIKYVVVNSDASSDKTESIAKTATELPVKVLTHKDRKGIAVRLNDIIQVAKEEHVSALVLFDADIRIPDRNCIQNLIQPIVEKHIDLTSCKISEVTPINLIDKSLQVSMNIKSEIFDNLRTGDNIYTCYGPVRALSAQLVSSLQFPYSIGNDAYTYLYAKKLGLRYEFVHTTSVNYKLPTVLGDHTNQSQRFLESQKKLSKDFGLNTIKTEYAIPLSLKLKALLAYFCKEPVLVSIYLSILLSMKVKYLFNKGMPDLWEHVSSSKTLS